MLQINRIIKLIGTLRDGDAYPMLLVAIGVDAYEFIKDGFTSLSMTGKYSLPGIVEIKEITHFANRFMTKEAYINEVHAKLSKHGKKFITTSGK